MPRPFKVQNQNRQGKLNFWNPWLFKITFFSKIIKSCFYLFLKYFSTKKRITLHIQCGSKRIPIVLKCFFFLILQHFMGCYVIHLKTYFSHDLTAKSWFGRSLHSNSARSRNHPYSNTTGGHFLGATLSI